MIETALYSMVVSGVLATIVVVWLLLWDNWS